MSRWALLLLAALALSACYAHDTLVAVEPDGSGTITIMIGVNKAYEQQQQANDALPTDSNIASTIENTLTSETDDMPSGWQPTVTPWDDGTYAGAKLTLQFENPTMLQEQLSDILQTTQNSSYNNMFVSLTAHQQPGTVQVIAVVQGQEFKANGEPLPPGPEGAGRISWSVAMPQLETCQPAQFATCTNTSASWVVPMGQLSRQETLILDVRGQVSAERTTAPKITAQPTPTASATSTPFPTPTLPPAPTPVDPSPNLSAPSTTTPPLEDVSAPLEDPSTPALGVGTATLELVPSTLPEIAGPSKTLTPAALTIVPSASVAVIAAEPTGAASAVPFTTEIAGGGGITFTPVAVAEPPANAAGATVAGQPGSPPTQAKHAFLPLAVGPERAPAGASPSGEPATVVPPTNPIARYHNLLIAILLLCSALCLGYVGVRRMQRRARVERAEDTR